LTTVTKGPFATERKLTSVPDEDTTCVLHKKIESSGRPWQTK